MKLAAHPLVVAVALGLLDANALSTLDTDTTNPDDKNRATVDGEAVGATSPLSRAPIANDVAVDEEMVELRTTLDEALSLLS